MRSAEAVRGLGRWVGERRGVTSLVARQLRSAGPYLFIELLLPGGTLFSLLLFLYRRGGAELAPPSNDGSVRPLIVVARIAAGFRSIWC